MSRTRRANDEIQDKAFLTQLASVCDKGGPKMLGEFVQWCSFKEVRGPPKDKDQKKGTDKDKQDKGSEMKDAEAKQVIFKLGQCPLTSIKVGDEQGVIVAMRFRMILIQYLSSLPETVVTTGPAPPMPLEREAQSNLKKLQRKKK